MSSNNTSQSLTFVTANIAAITTKSFKNGGSVKKIFAISNDPKTGATKYNFDLFSPKFEKANATLAALGESAVGSFCTFGVKSYTNKAGYVETVCCSIKVLRAGRSQKNAALAAELQSETAAAAQTASENLLGF